jgi:hypothetical protein
VLDTSSGASSVSAIASRRNVTTAVVDMRRLLAAGIVLVFVACAGAGGVGGSDSEPTSPPEESPPTAIDLNGIWLQVEDPDALGMMMRFDPDSSFASDDRGELFSTPAAQGTFEVDGDAIAFTTDERSDLCADGERWGWRATLPQDGLLRIEHTEGGTGDCHVPTGTEWTMIRLYRPSATVHAITPPVSTGGRPPDAGELTGIWLQVDPAGLMIRFTVDGGFAMDNGGDFSNPSVAGTYSRDGDVIRFPHVAGHACPGDTFAWRLSLPEEGLLAVEHVEEASGNCRISNGTRWTFIRISPSSPASIRLTAGLTE